jgi:hypothetical protein
MVSKLVAEAHTTEEIAVSCSSSIKTVARHRENILANWTCVTASSSRAGGLPRVRRGVAAALWGGVPMARRPPEHQDAEHDQIE